MELKSDARNSSYEFSKSHNNSAVSCDSLTEIPLRNSFVFNLDIFQTTLNISRAPKLLITREMHSFAKVQVPKHQGNNSFRNATHFFKFRLRLAIHNYLSTSTTSDNHLCDPNIKVTATLLLHHCSNIDILHLLRKSTNITSLFILREVSTNNV